MAEPYLTFLCQTTRQWLGLWRPIHHRSGTDKPAEYDIELDIRPTAQFIPHKTQTSLEDVLCAASQRLCRPQCHSSGINYLQFEVVGFM